MASSLNRLEVIGHLGRDPEMNYTPTGKAVTKFSVAVNDRKSDGQGGYEETTMWLNIVTWEKLAETCNNYLHKGSKVFLAGKLSIREFTRQDNSKGTAVELVATEMLMLDSKAGNGNGNNTTKRTPVPAGARDPDDIPF